MGVQTQTKITKTKIPTRGFLTEKYKYKRDEDKYNIIVNKRRMQYQICKGMNTYLTFAAVYWLDRKLKSGANTNTNTLHSMFSFYSRLLTWTKIQMKHKKRAGSTKNTNMTQNGDKCKWISHLVSTSSMSDIYSSLQTGTKTQMKKQK